MVAVSLARRLDVLQSSMQNLSLGTEDVQEEKTFSAITDMAQRSGTLIGDMAGAVLAFRRAQQERSLAQTELREREEMVSAIVSQAPIGIVVVDLETLHFTTFNHATYAPLGYTEEEFGQLTIYDIQATKTPAEVDDLVDRIIASNGMEFENQKSISSFQQVLLPAGHLDGKSTHF